MRRMLQFSRTYWRIGFPSVARVALYRLACKWGIYRLILPECPFDGGALFFDPSAWQVPPGISPSSRSELLRRAEALLEGELDYFSLHRKRIGAPPDWFLDPFSGNHLAHAGHWSRVKEFSSADIKTVWEASRFEWATVFARAFRVGGDRRYIEALNEWLGDWARSNPVNRGPNWKCGQETAIRCLNLLLCARILGVHLRPVQALSLLVAQHLSRIVQSIGYAIGQDNNHGTSEAAALFVGGAWLAAVADSVSLRKKGERWREKGRRWLEDRVHVLVGQDGSFSQYSVNYHRVLLDTVSQVELWRRELGEPTFSEGYLDRCRAAALWLASVTDPETGNAPNVGANDGARLYDLSCSGYRDFRPSTQLASVLFFGRCAYLASSCDEPLFWLELEPAVQELVPLPCSVIHAEGGDVVLREGGAMAMIRFASYRFRPGHADCLHLDLWHRGANVLRDGGTYSYNAAPGWLEYFSGSESHNTVQFDGRSQMPRLGRFLFGEWLKMEECSGICREGGVLQWSGAYTDWKGVWHKRTVRAREREWNVVDEMAGHEDTAILRWRLAPGEWRLCGNVCSSDYASMTVTATAPLRRAELVTGWESLGYLEKTRIPVLEIELGPGRSVVETRISLSEG